MLKVIFINRYFYPDQSATSQLLTDLAFSMTDIGKEIHVITSQQSYSGDNHSLPRKEIVRDVHIHRIRTTHFGRAALIGRSIDYLSFYFSSMTLLLTLTSKEDMIVAETDPPLISIVAAFVAKLKAARLINWLQDLFPEVATELGVKIARPPLSTLLKFLRNRTLYYADKNVVIGTLMADKLEKEGVPKEKISTIHNWADGTKIQPIKPDNNPFRKAWNLNNKFVIGYSGNMGRSHDFDTILEAIHILKDDPSIVFLFIGDGAQLPRIREEISKRDLSNVVFKPYQDRERLAESLSACDVHLITLKSTLEGLIVPSKFYGIAAAGRPSIFIGDPNGEIAQILQKYDCGISIIEGDGVALAEAIHQLKGNPTRHLELSENARHMFAQYFGFIIAEEKWRSILTQPNTPSNIAIESN